MSRTKPKSRVPFAALAALVGTAPPLHAQHVHGLVLYSPDDRPVAMATVRLVSERGEVLETALSGLDGRFSLRVPADGVYYVHAEHLTALAMVDGPLAAVTSANTFVTFHLAPDPLALEGLAVEVGGRSLPLARTGFYERREITPGFFVTPEDVARRQPVRTSDLVRTIPGVRYIEAPGVAGFHGYPVMSYALRSDAFSDASTPCFPRVYVDGVLFEPGGKAFPATGFDDLVRAQDVVAMELYRSPAETPAQFGGLSACGVILLWTRAGRYGAASR